MAWKNYVQRSDRPVFAACQLTNSNMHDVLSAAGFKAEHHAADVYKIKERLLGTIIGYACVGDYLVKAPNGTYSITGERYFPEIYDPAPAPAPEKS